MTRNRNNIDKLPRDQWFQFVFWGTERIDLKRPLRWAQELQQIVRCLQQAPTRNDISMFWIRLYGVLNDMLNSYKRDETARDPDGRNDDCADQSEYEDAQDEYFADLAADVHQACQLILRSLTEDELLAVMWFRDYEAHVFLSAYEPSINKSGEVNWARNKTLLGRGVPHDDVHAAVSRLRHGTDDVGVATQLAAKIALACDALVEALAAWPDA
jgi:hypothetical protein